MKSARSFSSSSNKNKQNCQSHNYCIHQHYQKCQTYRNSKIAYNIFPTQNLNALVNVHRKCTNQYSYNFKTLAYQKFVMGKQPQTQIDRNFVKNYYLENVPQKIVITNQIVQQLQDEVFPFNAYNLAQGATKDYYEFEYKRQQYLVTARKRAKNNSKAFVAELKQQAKRNTQQRQRWIQKILSTLQDLGQRMFGLTSSNKQNESQNGKQRIFLNEKSYVDQKYLKNYKIRDVQTSKRIFEDLRAVMLRKKRKFQDQRIKNKNVNLTMSQLNDSTANQSSVNSVSQSMISAATSQADQQKNEQKMISQLCDFENLKKKWKSLDVQRIKDMILSTLTRKIIFNCQGQKAKKISSKKRQSQSIPVKFSGKLQKQKDIKRSVTNAKYATTNKDEMKVLNKTKLTKQESQTKQKLLKTGQYDVAGKRYQHARNYSELFRRKENNLGLNLSLMVDNKEWQGQRQKNNVESYRGQTLTNQTTTKWMIKGNKTTRATSLRM